MAQRVLVVDDERDLTTAVAHFLRREGYQVLTAHDGRTGLDLARRERPHLVLLDLMMPAFSGTEVLKALKSDGATRSIPVIILTARHDEIDRVLGFELGADDYVTKPFNLRELVMRMRSVLRRGAEPDPGLAGILSAGPIEIHVESHDVFVSGKRIYLTLTEFRLLADLARARGRVRSRDALLAEVWGYDSEIESRTLDTHVRRLRTKLGGASNWLKTVRGVGYRIEAPDAGGAGIQDDTGDEAP